MRGGKCNSGLSFCGVMFEDNWTRRTSLRWGKDRHVHCQSKSYIPPLWSLKYLSGNHQMNNCISNQNRLYYYLLPKIWDNSSNKRPNLFHPTHFDWSNCKDIRRDQSIGKPTMILLSCFGNNLSSVWNLDETLNQTFTSIQQTLPNDIDVRQFNPGFASTFKEYSKVPLVNGYETEFRRSGESFLTQIPRPMKFQRCLCPRQVNHPRSSKYFYLRWR